MQPTRISMTGGWGLASRGRSFSTLLTCSELLTVTKQLNLFAFLLKSNCVSLFPFKSVAEQCSVCSRHLCTVGRPIVLLFWFGRRQRPPRERVLLYVRERDGCRLPTRYLSQSRRCFNVHCFNSRGTYVGIQTTLLWWVIVQVMVLLSWKVTYCKIWWIFKF